MQFIFSNDIVKLKEEFLNNFSLSIPFEKKLIIVPNINLKKYLQLELARKNGISANLNILYLESGLFFLLKESFNIEEKYIFLNESDNIINLQLMIISILKNEFDSFKVIKDYLKNRNNHNLLWELSKKIAFYFREYQYQIPELLDRWEKDEDYFDNEIERDFKLIYRKTFCEEDAYIKKLSTENKIYTILPILVKNLENKILKNEDKKEVYFFGFSQIPQFHYGLIEKLSDFYNFKIFQLNYQKIDSNFVLKNNNEFIKKYAIAIEKNFKIIPEKLKQNIEVKNNDFSTNSLLNCLKKSLLNDIKLNARQDKTIQIIGCPSVKREVETVYNSIIYNMLTDEELKLTDIAILVTDIDRYRYEIKNVFDYYGNIRYNLNDFTINIESNFLKAVSKFLELIGSDYKKSKIIDLITNPLIMKKFNFNNDIEDILNTIEDLNIYFSYDMESKKEYSNFQTPYFTWEYGLKRIRMGYLTEENDEIPPYTNRFLKEARNIDTLNLFFETLFDRLNIETRLTGAEWKEKLLNFIEEFIEIEQDNSIEENVRNNFLKLLDSIEIFDNILNEKIDIKYIKRYIEENIENIEFRKGSFLSDGVTISKMVPMKPIPFKIIYIIGLNEDIFPSYQSETSIDLRQKFPDYITKTEVDNYLFLETILSAQNKLYLTYVSKDIQKDAILYPSSCIKDLVSYMNNILTEKFKTFEVTINLEDEKNFIENNNELTDIYNCCINEKIRLRNSFTRESNTSKNIRIKTSKKDEGRLSLNDLKEYIFSPKKILLKNKLRIDLTRFERFRKSDIEPFYERKYEINNLKKEIFINVLYDKEIKDDIYKKIEFEKKIGDKPEDFFSDFIKYKIINEIEKIKTHKDNKKIKDILLKSNLYREIVFDFLNPNDNNIFEPYFKKGLNITGKIENVFKDGNNIYFFDLYDQNVITKEKKIKNYNLIKNIFRTVLDFGLLSKKKEGLRYNYLVLQNNNIYNLKYENASCFFDNILNDYINDINNDVIYDIDFDIITELLSQQKEFNIEEYRRLLEYKFDDENTKNYRIEDKDILLKDVNYDITEDIFNKRYNIIKEIEINEVWFRPIKHKKFTWFFR